MENVRKISTGKSLSKAIQAIIEEAMHDNLSSNAAEEEKKQKEFLEEEDLFDDESSSPSQSKTVKDEKEKLKTGEIDVDDVIQKLNTIRSGKSFKDEIIKLKLSEYVESLTRPEKTALFAFLKGIAQLVTGEFDAESASDPSDNPADVKMEKGSTLQKKTVKPNVIKTPAPAKEEKKKSTEDTSGPVPIKPKK